MLTELGVLKQIVLHPAHQSMHCFFVVWIFLVLNGQKGHCILIAANQKCQKV